MSDRHVGGLDKDWREAAQCRVVLNRWERRGCKTQGGWEEGPIPSVDGWVGVVCRLDSVLF